MAKEKRTAGVLVTRIKHRTNNELKNGARAKTFKKLKEKATN